MFTGRQILKFLSKKSSSYNRSNLMWYIQNSNRAQKILKIDNAAHFCLYNQSRNETRQRKKRHSYPVHAQTYRPLSAIRMIQRVIRKQTFTHIQKSHVTTRVPTHLRTTFASTMLLWYIHLVLVQIEFYVNSRICNNWQVLLGFVILHTVNICKFL